MKEEEFFENLETEELELNENFGSEALESAELDLKAIGILRIDENVKHSWRGVKNCGDKNRINNECRRAMENWAKNKMFEYSEYRWIKYGNKSSSVRVTQRRARLSGRRSCSASTTIPCYIEFRVP